jgi:hypothetical protein
MEDKGSKILAISTDSTASASHFYQLELSFQAVKLLRFVLPFPHFCVSDK